MPPVSRAAVVVVTYNSEAEVGECLDAALAAGAEVVVVDNASTDGTREEVRRRPEVRLIANPWNRGFAAAVNQGVAATAQPYVLLLNPDAVPAGSLDPLTAACEDGAGIASGLLMNDDGAPQAGFTVRRFPTPAALTFETLGLNRLWPGNPVNRRYRCLDLDLTRPATVEQPAGAFLMFRRDVWRELGGFDERFRPLWFEDVDFCKRAARAGYRIQFVPEAAARHRGAHSIKKLNSAQRRSYWYGSLSRYTAKHYGLLGRWVVGLAVALRSVVGIRTGEG